MKGPQIGKMFWLLRITRRYYRMDPPGWFVFECAVVKFLSLPEEGEVIQKRHYKGVWIRFAFWIPFDAA